MERLNVTAFHNGRAQIFDLLFRNGPTKVVRHVWAGSGAGETFSLPSQTKWVLGWDWGMEYDSLT
jgi:hypothetical protein